MIDELIRIFEATVRFMEQSADDLSEEEMVLQPAGVPNYATWRIGHIIYSCQGIATEVGDEPWLPDDWESTFGYGSTPHLEQQKYPRKAQLLAALTDAKRRLCHTVQNLDASVLRRQLPDEVFPTMSHLLLQVLAAHTAYQAGQLAVRRRAMGKESVAVFV